MAGFHILPPPGCFDIHDRDAGEHWKDWKERWMCYATATELDKKSKDIQVSVFLTVIGAEAHKVFKTFQLTEEGRKNPETVLAAFEGYCQPRRNTALERYRFNLRGQRTGEPFEQYVTTLRQLALTCDFENITPEQILRDRIMFGIADDKVRDRLLRENDLTLERTLNICRASEMSAAQQEEVSRMNSNSVHALNRSKMHMKTRGATALENTQGDQEETEWITDCLYCGRAHKKIKEECPAWGRSCMKCKKRNHFRIKCPMMRKSGAFAGFQRINSINPDPEDTSDFHIFSVKTVASVKLQEEQTVTLRIRPKCFIRFQIDCGADCNILPVHVYKAATGDWKLEQVSISRTTLYVYGQIATRSVGKVQIQVWRKERTISLLCELLDGDQYHSILGYQACVALDILEIKDNDKKNPIRDYEEQQIHSLQLDSGLSTKEQVIKCYPKVFRETVGKLPMCYKIRIDESVNPVQHAPRRVPAAMRAKLQCELEQLEQQGIISKVTQPTDWVSSLLVVPKSDSKLRICIDPRDLNLAIRREHYHMPTIEDIASRLAGARVFTVLDVKQGFWHVPLEEQSSYLTTFNSPFGRYRWLRMPFGICSAPEVFQRCMHQLIEGLPGIEVVADDFMVYGSGPTHKEAVMDHDKNLKGFLQRCEEKDVVLGAKKFNLRQSEVPFIGHLATENGLKPAPQKVEALVDMPAPNDVAGVRRFLGMVQYLSKFLPKLADMTKPLRELTQKSVDFVWETSQERSFQAVKKAASNAPVLRYYSLDMEVTVQCDSSQFGLGAALMQGGQPVAFASRALSETEQRYAQIEKECLSIVFSCERFHHYLFGREEVHIQTDHQPLVSIFKKPLCAAPSRLQRMLLYLQRYTLNVNYVSGKHMFLADTLSRAYLTRIPVKSAFVNSLEVSDYKRTLLVSEERLQEIRNHLQEDEVLQEVGLLTEKGWPETRCKASEMARPYFNYRDELHLEDGLLFKGNRLVVPRALRKQMLEIAHQGHIGLEGCLRRMREALFWPGMSSELKALIQECDACLGNRDMPPKEPLKCHDFALRPWSKVGADLCHLDDRTLLVVVDYYSGFIEVTKPRNITSNGIIRELQIVFSRHGVPDVLVTDNGPQFPTPEFSAFCRGWAFQHVTSSPRYPQSNGKAENAVKTIKRLFTKCKSSGESEFLALLNWNNTPNEGMQTSPSQRLMGRRCKTVMPCKSTLLKPRYSTERDDHDLMKRKDTQAHYYNRGTRSLPPISSGDPIRMRLPGNKEWTPGKCVKEVAPRSYLVNVGGRKYRRNRRQLLLTREDSPKEILNEEANEDNMERMASYSFNEEKSPVEFQKAEPEVEIEEDSQADSSVRVLPAQLRRSNRIKRPLLRYGYND